MKRILEIVFGAILLLSAAKAEAQTSSPGPTAILSGQVPLSVSNTSARVALPSTAAAAYAVTIFNKGAKDAFFAVGDSSVAATTASVQLPAGSFLSQVVTPGSYIAAIAGGSDTTNLVIYQGTGPINFGASGISSGSGSGTSNQGTPNTAANGWPVKVTDGTNTAAVKAASTAPATTDPAVVVAISPNSVNPNGQATPANSAPVVQAPLAGSDGSTTITSGGTAQSLFAAATPSNGFEVCNPNLSDDLWVSWSATAVVNGTGSQRVAANGGCYSSSYAPFNAISVIGPTTGDKITATKW